MDADRFDAVTRSLREARSRRGLTRLLGALTLGGPLALLGAAETEAKRKKKKKKKTGTTPTATAPPPGPGPVSPPPPPRVVISQIFARGGGTGAAFKNDYIELFNRGETQATIDNWSVQFSSPTGTTWDTTPLLGITMPPSSYLLVKGAGSGTNGADLPPPDVDGNLSLLDGGGRVALVSSTTPLGCGADPSCVTAPGVIDFLGYGANGAAGEGGAPAPAPGANALFRDDAGCTDTNNNALDFSLGTPDPRNSNNRALACP